MLPKWKTSTRIQILNGAIEKETKAEKWNEMNTAAAAAE